MLIKDDNEYVIFLRDLVTKIPDSTHLKTSEIAFLRHLMVFFMIDDRCRRKNGRRNLRILRTYRDDKEFNVYR